MSTAGSQSDTKYDRPSLVLRVALFVQLLVVIVSPAVWANPVNQPPPSIASAEPETFGLATPLGRLSYQVGRGLRVGNTGLVLGGFTTAEAERLEGGKRSGGLDQVNFLAFIDPVPYLHLFTELELGDLAILESGQEGVRSGGKLEVKRLYLDFGMSDALNIRFGKFLTPIGRWNVVRIEPLLWTTSDPVIVDQVFDKTVTGAMVHGLVFPPGGALSYSLYGTFLNPFDVPSDEHPAKRNAGARLEWADLRGWTVGASYFASELQKGKWHHLGGTDLLWQPHARVEVSGEAVFGKGSLEDGTLWGLYAQTVVETVRTLYLVGRYERFDPSGERPVNLFDLGLAWVPVPYLRLKADYLIADHLGEFSEPGLRISLSLLF